MKTSHLIVLSVLYLLSPYTAHAQQPAIVTGTVTDPSGRPIAGALVSARPQRGSPVTVRTQSDGSYRLELTAGNYRLRIEQSSFQPAERELRLAAGELLQWNVALRLEPLAASVTVTAEAEPIPTGQAPTEVDVVSGHYLEQSHQLWLAPVLNTLPGVAISQLGPMGGVTTLFLDGGNSNFTKVLVDGVPANEPGGALDFSNISLENIEKVEVVHGAASALFGSDAMTGVIQIFTRRGSTSQPQLDVYADGGKFSTWHTAVQLAGRLGSFDYAAAAAGFDTQGQQPNNRFRDNTLSGNFGYQLTPAQSVRLVLRSSDSDAGEPGQTLFLPPDLHQHDALRNFSAAASWDDQAGDWHHHVSVGESYLREIYADVPLFVVRNEYNRVDLNADTTRTAGVAALTAGYQYEVENGFFNGTHARRNNQAGFLEARLAGRQRLSALAGVRAEANDSFGTRVVPRLGASFLLRRGSGPWGSTRLYSSYGLGIKEPSFLQSFSQDPCFPGNPGLRPERSQTFLAGIEQTWAGDRLQLDLNYFHNTFRDIVSFGFLPATPTCPFGTGSYFNTDKARAYGAHARFEARAARWLEFTGNYTYDNTRVLRAPNAFDPTLTPGNRLFLRPLHAGTLATQVGLRRTTWLLEAVYVGRRTDSDFLGLGMTSVPDYLIVNLATTWPLGRGLSAYARVENLLDRRYQIALGFPAQRLTCRAGLHYRWGGGR